MKEHVNQLIEAQPTQQETLVHIVSILNVTRYAAVLGHNHQYMINSSDITIRLSTQVVTAVTNHDQFNKGHA